MRGFFVLLHRWFGLFIAVFLLIAGLTGAIISWDHELDEWLNPEFFVANSGAIKNSSATHALRLANQLEANDPRIIVTFLPLSIEPGHTLEIGVGAKTDITTGIAVDPGFNQVAIDPANGDIQGRRQWGAISLARENLLPFLYKLHYSLHIPDGFNLSLGVWIMGIVAIVWLLDNFIALWISFPNLKGWRKSFAFRWKKGSYKLIFDLHRSGGVWVWVLLLILAITSVSMNLSSQIVRPLVNAISPLTPNVFDERDPAPVERPITPVYTRERILQAALAEANKRSWALPAGSIFYNELIGIYGVGFYEPGAAHGDGGLGNPWLYFDSTSGELAGISIPGEGSAGDLFMQLQFPLHSGRIIGLPGRILISCMGLIIAMLSVTGIIIWMRKRWARAKS